MSSLVWFRSDLRVTDHAALAAASATGGAVAGLFLIADDEWRNHGWGPRRQRFVWEHVLALRAALAQLGIPLTVLHVPRFADAAAAVLGQARRLGSGSVFAHAEYGVDELSRDRAVKLQCAAAGIRFEALPGFTLLAPGAVRTRTGEPFKVFTPFRRAWLAQMRNAALGCLPAPRCGPAIEPAPLPTWQPPRTGFNTAVWPVGEHAALARLQHFLDHRICNYDSARDVPSLDATSRLSPYLACGAISARQCFSAALAHNDGEWDTGSPGVQCWLSELVWREFYTHVLVAFPRVSRNRAFRPATEALPWRNDPEGLRRWEQGQTGFPLVDAGMRQLLDEGWMHNRLRMLTAMFLSKYLLIDWRRGERHFMDRLMDGDLAANNGGWQWSASTGTDAAPYFRTLCPMRQAERFDADGTFVRRYVPELAACPARALLKPGDPALLANGYPAPMLDLRESRKRAMDAFAAVSAEPAR